MGTAAWWVEEPQESVVVQGVVATRTVALAQVKLLLVSLGSSGRQGM
jgi:hypothetical protein